MQHNIIFKYLASTSHSIILSRKLQLMSNMVHKVRVDKKNPYRPKFLIATRMPKTSHHRLENLHQFHLTTISPIERVPFENLWRAATQKQKG